MFKESGCGSQALLPPVLTATSYHRHFPRGWAQSEKAALGSTILTLQIRNYKCESCGQVTSL